MMMSVASGERSFSKLKLIKNRLRSAIAQDKLSELSIMSIEFDILRGIDFTDIVSDFVSKKVRRKAR